MENKNNSNENNNVDKCVNMSEKIKKLEKKMLGKAAAFTEIDLILS